MQFHPRILARLVGRVDAVVADDNLAALAVGLQMIDEEIADERSIRPAADTHQKPGQLAVAEDALVAPFHLFGDFVPDEIFGEERHRDMKSFAVGGCLQGTRQGI